MTQLSQYFDIKRDSEGRKYVEVYLDGIALLRLVMTNKGTAFTHDERVALGLDGLLPPQVNTMEQQIDRVYRGFQREPDPLAKYQYLRALQERSFRRIGGSQEMQPLFRLIARCAPTNSTVMLRGESGTGKELIARAIHYNSLRSDHAFVPVDCTSLSENLLESELFGHVKGSFTGAVSNKKGLFEMADGGTLFLDEIGNIPLSTQAKLLRFIEEREFKAVGDTRTQSVDIRLVTATNKDLEGMVADGDFRDDLYYRINIFPIEIPPLRERREDIPALASHFLQQFSGEMKQPTREFSPGAMNLLMNHDWPGNVRELENVVERAVILASGDVIRQGHLVNIIDMLPHIDLDVPRTSEELKQVKKIARRKSVENVEKHFVLRALKRNRWNVTRAAEDTGMQRSNFQALMAKYDIRIRGIAPDDGPE